MAPTESRRPVTWFHEAEWVERQIPLQGNTMTWKPVKKLWEWSSRTAKEDADKFGRPPFGAAEFLCRSVEMPSAEAYLKVWMQFPYEGTEGLQGRFRAKQATMEKLPRNPSDEIQAWRRLDANNVQATGRLIGQKREAQGDEGPVPGGWSVYILVSKVPGIRLGGKESELKDGIFRWTGYFWNLDRPTRDLIRAQFEAAFKRIRSSEVCIQAEGLSCLYWDAEAKRLYIHAKVDLPIDPWVDTGLPLPPSLLSSYGLAQAPYQASYVEEGKVSIKRLEELGWKF